MFLLAWLLLLTVSSTFIHIAAIARVFILASLFSLLSMRSRFVLLAGLESAIMLARDIVVVLLVLIECIRFRIAVLALSRWCLILALLAVEVLLGLSRVIAVTPTVELSVAFLVGMHIVSVV